MDALTDIGRTEAEERFLEAIHYATHGVEKYPPGSAFIDVERLDDLAPMLARYARDRRPLVFVYPDGDERVLVPPVQLFSGFAHVRSAFRGRLLRLWR